MGTPWISIPKHWFILAIRELGAVEFEFEDHRGNVQDYRSFKINRLFGEARSRRAGFEHLHN